MKITIEQSKNDDYFASTKSDMIKRIDVNSFCCWFKLCAQNPEKGGKEYETFETKHGIHSGHAGMLHLSWNGRITDEGIGVYRKKDHAE